jgi:pyridoxine 5'-phosphate synthase PdxJ
MKAYQSMITTDGWKFLIDDLEAKVKELQNQESEVSSFRVFKCMELKNQIRNLKNLKNSCMKAEKLGLVMSAKD